jgi:hypothetical protein
MDIQNGSQIYQVGKPVAENDKYHLYLCTQKETGRQCLLQIVTATEHNGDLDRAAYILRELKRHADELEEEYAKVKTDQKDLLNYDLGFPELVDSFVCQEQGGRRVNILAFKNVENVGRMVPLSNITTKDQLCVDLRTSVWIMGKLLKLLVLAHSERISAGLVTSENILIEPDQHYVLIFDWSKARTYPDAVPLETRCSEISQAAKAIITVLGGDSETGVFPDDSDEIFDRYTDHLLRLALGSESNAERAHAKFYELTDALWKREFYPFTTKPLHE